MFFFFFFFNTQVTLQSNVLYELKDGSTIEFGRVAAVYHACYSANDTLIPETPALARRKGTTTIIPNTPDSSFVSTYICAIIQFTRHFHVLICLFDI